MGSRAWLWGWAPARRSCDPAAHRDRRDRLGRGARRLGFGAKTASPVSRLLTFEGESFFAVDGGAAVYPASTGLDDASFFVTSAVFRMVPTTLTSPRGAIETPGARPVSMANSAASCDAMKRPPCWMKSRRCVRRFARRVGCRAWSRCGRGFGVRSDFCHAWRCPTWGCR